MKETNQKCKWEELAWFTWDSTPITMTTKLLGIKEFIKKMLSVINLRNSEVSGVSLHFGTNDDSK